MCVTAAVLAMASSSKLNSTTTSRIADALNEASALGLNGKDSDNLNELIAEYFGEDVASDSESEEEIEADEDEESTTPMNTNEDDDFVQQEDDNDHEWDREDIEENEEPVNVDLAEGTRGTPRVQFANIRKMVLCQGLPRCLRLCVNPCMERHAQSLNSSLHA